jgi:menaquinone-dependent protoporphyrinogen oxidase
MVVRVPERAVRSKVGTGKGSLHPPKPEEVPVDVADISDLTSARSHQVFSGKIDKSKLSFGEKAIVVAVRAPEGDFRDWDEIRRWANAIADSLTREALAV